MKKVTSFPLLMLVPAALHGIYAPVPTQVDSSLPFNISLRTGVHYDTNVLGQHQNEIESAVYTVAPRIEYNAEPSTATRVNLAYRLSARFYEDRPTNDSLYNHTITGRMVHEFNQGSRIIISDAFTIVDDPESFLTGELVVNQADQSHDRNVFNLRLDNTVSPKLNVNLKFRNTDISYDQARLADALDYNSNLFGAEGSYEMQADTRIVVEYRYQSISYDVDGAFKDSDSNFILGGVDYDTGPKMTLSARAGVEDRDRDVGTSNTSFYGQFQLLYRYNQDLSFVSLGVTYDVQETSAPITFSDEEVISIFANIQHALSASLFASASIYYDQADLLAQNALADITDETIRLGFSLTYQPTPQWSIIFSYDYDNTESDSAFREEERSRVGISARYTFGM